MSSLVALKTVLPRDIRPYRFREAEIDIPKWAYFPDPWCHTMIRALYRYADEGSLDFAHIWEIGCGPGVTLMMLRHLFPNATLRFSDIDPRCVGLSMSNFTRVGFTADGLEPISGECDLIGSSDGIITPDELGEDEIQDDSVDFITFCGPQIPKTRSMKMGARDNRAHYYHPGHYQGESRLNAVGLALVDTLLERAKNVLRPGGRVLLILAGRPGLGVLLDMFHDRGYKSMRLMAEKMVLHHPDTKLQQLADLEPRIRFEFEFFRYENGDGQINAARAERLRKSTKPGPYHMVYALEGTLPKDDSL